MATTEDTVRLSGGVDTEYLDLLRFQAFLYYYHYVVMNNYKGDFGVLYECQQTPRGNRSAWDVTTICRSEVSLSLTVNTHQLVTPCPAKTFIYSLHHIMIKFAPLQYDCGMEK